ncbi:MAG TPA: helix-turn-helix domain-containing protein, partial [Puia sp.]|nr:helix-turn-helix domain-containing protein [Puia sp.]
VIRRAALLTTSGLINARVLPPEIADMNAFTPTQAGPSIPSHPIIHKEMDLKNAAAQAEYDTIMNVLKQVNYNKSRAAEILKIDRKTLYNKIKSYQP